MTKGEIIRLIHSFPKERPKLSDVYKKIYYSEYKGNRSFEEIVNKLKILLKSRMHKNIVRIKGKNILLANLK